MTVPSAKVGEAIRTLQSSYREMGEAVETVTSALDTLRTILNREWKVVRQGKLEYLVPVNLSYDEFLALKKVVGMPLPHSVIADAVKTAVTPRA